MAIYSGPKFMQEIVPGRFHGDKTPREIIIVGEPNKGKEINCPEESILGDNCAEGSC